MIAFFMNLRTVIIRDVENVRNIIKRKKTSVLLNEVSSLANKRMMCLVCKSGQSNSSALMMLRSSG